MTAGGERGPGEPWRRRENRARDMNRGTDRKTEPSRIHGGEKISKETGQKRAGKTQSRAKEGGKPEGSHKLRETKGRQARGPFLFLQLHEHNK